MQIYTHNNAAVAALANALDADPLSAAQLPAVMGDRLFELLDFENSNLVKELRERLEDAEKEARSATERADAAEAHNDRLDKENDKLQERIDEREEWLSELCDNVEDLKDKLAELEKEVDHLQQLIIERDEQRETGL